MGHVLHSPHVTVGGACCARAALEKGDGRPLEGTSFVVSFRQDKKGKKTCLLPNGKRSFRIRAGKQIAPFRKMQNSITHAETSKTLLQAASQQKKSPAP